MNLLQQSRRNGVAIPGARRHDGVLKLLAASLCLAFGSGAYALPQGGVVAAGTAAISTTGAATTVTQSSANTVINWQSFNIATGQAVQFVQPSSSAVALNRVVGPDPSSIFGSLSSNGKVFLVNPNGILFGSGASVNVGGLVASTLDISDANFMSGKYVFSSAGNGAVVNQGNINADGGYVALLGARVNNLGVISARLGTVALAAGNAMTLDVAGDKLLNVTIDQGAVNALVENGGLIQSDGGTVLLTAQAAGQLLSTVVNNTGVIRAQTLSSVNGTIKLLGDMQSGTVNVGGTLDASAPNGGNGGFIETSAAHVMVKDGVVITTAAPLGQTGTWLIDPQDFTVGSAPTDNITGLNLSTLLVTNSVTISTAPGPDVMVAGAPPVTSLHTGTPGNGDININEVVAWSANPLTPTTLTLNAVRDININASISATEGNFSTCCGRDININAPVTIVRGSALFSAGRNVNQSAAITVTNGNLTMCAAQDVNVGAAISLTNGTIDPARSLGLALGLVLSADTDGTGPGVAGGTVVFAPLTPKAAITGPNAPVTINYNPVAYGLPTSYGGNFTLVTSVLTQHMLVFPDVANKVFDGSTSAVLNGLKGNPVGVNLVAGAGNAAAFESAAAGIAKPVDFSGYSLAGVNAGDYAFAVSCCGLITARTTGTISPAPVIPPVVPPLVIAPGQVAPVAGVQLAALSGTGSTTAGFPFADSLLSDAGDGELPLEGLAGFGAAAGFAGGTGAGGLPLSVLPSPGTPLLLSLAPPAPAPLPIVAPAPAIAAAPVAAPAAPFFAPARPRKQDRH